LLTGMKPSRGRRLRRSVILDKINAGIIRKHFAVRPQRQLGYILKIKSNLEGEYNASKERSCHTAEKKEIF